MQAGGRGETVETVVQRPLVSVGPLVDMTMGSDLHNIAACSKTSKTYSDSKEDMN